MSRKYLSLTLCYLILSHTSALQASSITEKQKIEYYLKYNAHIPLCSTTNFNSPTKIDFLGYLKLCAEVIEKIEKYQLTMRFKDPSLEEQAKLQEQIRYTQQLYKIVRQHFNQEDLLCVEEPALDMTRNGILTTKYNFEQIMPIVQCALLASQVYTIVSNHSAPNNYHARARMQKINLGAELMCAGALLCYNLSSYKLGDSKTQEDKLAWAAFCLGGISQHYVVRPKDGLQNLLWSHSVRDIMRHPEKQRFDRKMQAIALGIQMCVTAIFMRQNYKKYCLLRKERAPYEAQHTKLKELIQLGENNQKIIPVVQYLCEKNKLEIIFPEIKNIECQIPATLCNNIALYYGCNKKNAEIAEKLLPTQSAIEGINNHQPTTETPISLIAFGSFVAIGGCLYLRGLFKGKG